jgi:hypothetical protein
MDANTWSNIIVLHLYGWFMHSIMNQVRLFIYFFNICTVLGIIIAPLLYHNLMHWLVCLAALILIQYERKISWIIGWLYMIFVFTFIIKLLSSFVAFRIFGWSWTQTYEYYGITTFRSCTVGISVPLITLASYRIAERIPDQYPMSIITFMILILSHATVLPIGNDHSYMHEHLFGIIVGFVSFFIWRFIHKVTTEANKE